MKFVSKNANYRVILRPGESAERLTGRAAIPGLYVKFEHGNVNIADEDICKKMLSHPRFGIDFVLAAGSEEDRWARTRGGGEPAHDILELQYGAITKNVNPKPRLGLPADKMKIIEEMVEKMAKEMAPKLAAEMLKKLVEEKEIVKSEESEVKSEEPLPEPEIKSEIKLEEPEVQKPLRGRPRKVSENSTDLPQIDEK